MTELKPCPFCGHKIPENQPFWDDFDSDDVYYVIKCGWCGVMMYDQDKDELISNWNERVIQ